MFKRILGITLAIVLATTNCFAWFPGSKRIGAWMNEASSYSLQKQRGFGFLPQGLTFYKDFSQSQTNDAKSLNADYSIGSPTATFTRTGGNAAYIDASGYVKFVTASNTPRITYGTYDETGWRLFDTNGKLLKGLIIESAMTNRATYCNTPENAAWTKTNITADNDDAGSTSPDGTATAPSLTATAANATIVQSYAITGAAQTWTSSTFIKAKNITGKVYLAAVEDGTDKSEITIPNYWVRVSDTASTDGDDAGKDPAFYLELENSGDSVYVWNKQLENSPYMTSPIPSLTTAVARGSEILYYYINGNRSVFSETCYISYISEYNLNTVTGISSRLIDTDTSQRFLYYDAANGNVFSDGTYTAAFGNTSGLKNTKYTLAATFYPTGNPNIRTYYNKTAGGVSNSDKTGTFGTDTYFYIGRRLASDRNNNMIISNIAFFNSSHPVDIVNKVTELLL